MLSPESGAQINPLDTGRGRLIPTTSCDQYFAELALWLGVSQSSLPLILPNIGNFYAANSVTPPLGFFGLRLTITLQNLMKMGFLATKERKKHKAKIGFEMRTTVAFFHLSL